MTKIRLNQLNRAVRTFLANLLQDHHVIIEDDTGSTYNLKIERLKHAPQPKPKVQLPTWPGTVTTPLRRSDIYGGLR